MDALPNILVVGPSGSGKSTSLRNLNPETTAILNIERKQLPFKGATKFKYNKFLTTQGEVTTELVMGLGTNPAIDVVVLESFQSYCDDVLSYCRKQWTGWDVWSNHNRIIREFLSNSKDIAIPKKKPDGSFSKPKFVIFFALDEIVDIIQPSGNSESTRKAKVEGKELRGAIEQAFTCTLFTKVVENTIGGRTQMQYKFQTNTDGVTSAKTPMGLFNEMYIDNDLNLVINKLKDYYEIK